MIIFRPNPRDHSDIQKFDSGAEIKSPKTGFLTGLSIVQTLDYILDSCFLTCITPKSKVRY